jgi:predicted O-methyltransferase YrrM
MMDTAKARELLKTKNLTEMDITPFQQIPFKLKSQGRPRFHAMLNALARCMSPEEIYLEVGTYQGGSTIGTTRRAHSPWKISANSMAIRLWTIPA